MAFCQNCGKELRDGAKFCEECGEPVPGKQPKDNDEQRKQSFEGEIKKCPNCGQPLESFSTKCISCGYEIRGAQVSDSVKEFSKQISTITDEEQRIMLVRNFPIPNTKEDILEFMILASTNLKYKANDSFDGALSGKREADAWMAKFEQCYRKAELMLVDDPSFERIKSVYEQIQKDAKKSSRRINKINLASVIASIVVVGFGIGILVFAYILESSHENSSLAQLVGCVVIVGASVGLARKSASIIDDLICAIGAIVMEILSGWFRNGSMLKLCGAVVVIVLVVNLIRSFSRNKKDANQNGR